MQSLSQLLTEFLRLKMQDFPAQWKKLLTEVGNISVQCLMDNKKEREKISPEKMQRKKDPWKVLTNPFFVGQLWGKRSWVKEWTKRVGARKRDFNCRGLGGELADKFHLAGITQESHYSQRGIPIIGVCVRCRKTSYTNSISPPAEQRQSWRLCSST